MKSLEKLERATLSDEEMLILKAGSGDSSDEISPMGLFTNENRNYNCTCDNPKGKNINAAEFCTCGGKWKIVNSSNNCGQSFESKRPVEL